LVLLLLEEGRFEARKKDEEEKRPESRAVVGQASESGEGKGSKF
jgi:hypothetical protein